MLPAHLGARDNDIGQAGVSWVVIADPEGNEFCVLHSLAEKPSERPHPGD